MSLADGSEMERAGQVETRVALLGLWLEGRGSHPGGRRGHETKCKLGPAGVFLNPELLRLPHGGFV